MQAGWTQRDPPRSRLALPLYAQSDSLPRKKGGQQGPGVLLIDGPSPRRGHGSRSRAYPLRSLVPALHFCIHRGAEDLGPLAQRLLLLLPLPPALELSGLGCCCLSSGTNPWSTQGLPGWRLSTLLKSEQKLFLIKLRQPVPLACPVPCVPPQSQPLLLSRFPGPVTRATFLFLVSLHKHGDSWELTLSLLQGPLPLASRL